MSDLDPITAGIIRDLVQKVNSLDKRVRSQARASQARHRSVEGGTQSLYDEDDELRAVVGDLADGSFGVSVFGGEAPPVPSVPLVSPIPNGATITWDGFDANDEQGWDEGFRRVRVHQVTIPGDPPDAENMIGAFEAPGGGALTVAHPPDVTTYVSFVAESTSGLESVQSVEVPLTGGQFTVPDTGDLTAGGAFTGSAKVFRFGDMALVGIKITRAAGFSTDWTNVGITLPAGYRPAVVEQSPAFPFWDSVVAATDLYQFQVLTDGTVQVRQNASDASSMRATMIYVLPPPA